LPASKRTFEQIYLKPFSMQLSSKTFRALHVYDVVENVTVGITPKKQLIRSKNLKISGIGLQLYVTHVHSHGPGVYGAQRSGDAGTTA